MRKALIVGINNYDDGDVKNLSGCVNDANAVKEIFKFHADERLNFTIINPSLDIRKKVGLLDEIKELFSGSAETSIALFYFSGHGGFDEKLNEGYIITADYSPSIKNVIYMSEILDVVNASKIQNKVVVLDCCHAGAMGNVIQTVAALNEGVTILSASKSDELSLEFDGHGVFTSLFLLAVEGGAADLTGCVTAGGIYAYIDKALGPIGQRPVFKTNTAQFLPLRESEPPISIGILRKLSEYFNNAADEYDLDPSYEPKNTKDSSEHVSIEPYADEDNTDIFRDMQALNRVGLVIPCCDDLPADERHMYFAAMKSKSCKLTRLGHFYWKLASENKL